MKHIAIVAVLAFLRVSSLAACSSTTTSTGATPSCDDVCSHIGSVCGNAGSSCASDCAANTAAQRTCISGASTCNAAKACVLPVADAGSGDGGGSSCSCHGSDNGATATVNCGETSECTPEPDFNAIGHKFSCSAAGQLSETDCTPTLVANCGACTASSQCAPFHHGGGVSVTAACFNGHCRERCDPNGGAGCACVAGTPSDGDATGYCSGGC